MSEFAYHKFEEDSMRGCECCGCEVPTRLWKHSVAGDHYFCEVCSETNLCKAVNYPRQVADPSLYASIGSLGNMILDAINPRRHDGVPGSPISSLEGRVEALREALKFYADEWGYDYDQTGCPVRTNKSDILGDSGDVARKALEKDGLSNGES